MLQFSIGIVLQFLGSKLNYCIYVLSCMHKYTYTFTCVPEPAPARPPARIGHAVWWMCGFSKQRCYCKGSTRKRLTPFLHLSLSSGSGSAVRILCARRRGKSLACISIGGPFPRMPYVLIRIMNTKVGCMVNNVRCIHSLCDSSVALLGIPGQGKEYAMQCTGQTCTRQLWF